MLVNQKDIARIYGVTKYAITVWKKNPDFPRKVTGNGGAGGYLYELKAIRDWYNNYRHRRHYWQGHPRV